MVNVAVVVTSLPQSSVAVKVTEMELAQPPDQVAVLALLDQVMALQRSVAVAPPLLASQAM
jgi:hypothetical protein